MKDGWHTILGYDVYTEDNKVLRGTLGDGVTYRPAYPYKWNKRYRCWIKTTGINTSTFCKGVKRELIIMA